MKSSFVVEFPDPHLPSQDEKAIEAVLNFAADIHPPEFILLGDVLDFSFIGSFAQDQIKETFENGECWEDTWQAGQDFLDDVRKAVGKKCRIVYIEGNHDYRPKRILLKDPSRKGSVEVPKHLDLAKRDIFWVPFWETGQTYQIGKMSYGHGWYCTGNHTLKHLNDYGCNFTYGHSHTIETKTKAFKSSHDGTIKARTLGCLCKKDMPYMRGRPSSWVQGFGVTEFYDDGLFTSYEPVIINGKFSFAGKVYKA